VFLCVVDDEPALSSWATSAAAAAADTEPAGCHEPSTSPTTLSFAQVVTAALLGC